MLTQSFQCAFPTYWDRGTKSLILISKIIFQPQDDGSLSDPQLLSVPTSRSRRSTFRQDSFSSCGSFMSPSQYEETSEMESCYDIVGETSEGLDDKIMIKSDISFDEIGREISIDFTPRDKKHTHLHITFTRDMPLKTNTFEMYSRNIFGMKCEFAYDLPNKRQFTKHNKMRFLWKALLNFLNRKLSFAKLSYAAHSSDVAEAKMLLSCQFKTNKSMRGKILKINCISLYFIPEYFIRYLHF